MKRIKLNAVGKPVFDLAYGTPWINNKKWTFYTTVGILLQAVEAGFATVEIVDGTYGRTHFFKTNDGKLIREHYTDYTRGFDTWNPYKLPDGIVNLCATGVYDTTLDDIDAIAIMGCLPSIY